MLANPLALMVTHEGERNWSDHAATAQGHERDIEVVFTLAKSSPSVKS